MGRGSLAPLLVASLGGACQAFTGTGDLEVRGAAATGAGAGSSGGAGGQGGAAASAGGGGQGAGPSTSAGSAMMTGSQTASSGSGANCITCKEFFGGMGADMNALCADAQTAHDTLETCLCRNQMSANCVGASDACNNFCAGQPWSTDCSQCAQDVCGEAWMACQAK